jgi:4-hydroxy-tetrahydrodipicolinate reductase
MLKIALNGAVGRMGQEILTLVNAAPDEYRLSFAKSQNLVESAPSIIATWPLENSAQVIIDFSVPESCMETLDWCLVNNVPIVIGTTGFNEAQLERLHLAGLQIPVLLSPNMSLSVNIMFKVAALVAKSLAQAEVEIIESHHRYKKDAPSGTALGLGKAIAAARGVEFSQVAKFERCGVENQIRKPEEIGFAVVRGGDIIGKHTALFINDGEELSLTSEITNRRSFAAGALLAAKFLVAQPAGFYSMYDVLGLSTI